jgi:hypothetical protein
VGVIEEWLESECKQHDWIFTFGFGHVAPDGTSLRNRFIRIPGGFAEAREEMVRRFGLQWAFQYENEEEAGVAKYNLTEWVP